MARSVISLFSGAGGIDLGLEAAGFDTRVCVEMDRHACRTLRANRDWHVIESDLGLIPTRDLLRHAKLKRGELTLLAGGPPCQPFSKSGFWHSGATLRMRDPRASTLKHYLRVLEETLPKAFLIENVPGFAYEPDGMSYLVRRLTQLFKTTGVKYTISHAALNAADFGVPQRRERLFLIGTRSGVKFIFPQPTHSENGETGQRYRTSWDAIGDLENDVDPKEHAIGGKWAALLPSIPEGENYLFHTDRGGGMPLFEWRSRYWNFLLKLSKRLPSWTIQAQPGPATGPFHWKSRRLSEHEMRRLQTFPEDFKIIGELRSAQKQLGNAVPSALAEILGLEIRKQILGEKVRQKASLIPSVRPGPIRSAPIRPVPSLYSDATSRMRSSSRLLKESRIFVS